MFVIYVVDMCSKYLVVLWDFIFGRGSIVYLGGLIPGNNVGCTEVGSIRLSVI